MSFNPGQSLDVVERSTHQWSSIVSFVTYVIRLINERACTLLDPAER